MDFTLKCLFWKPHRPITAPGSSLRCSFSAPRLRFLLPLREALPCSALPWILVRKMSCTVWLSYLPISCPLLWYLSFCKRQGYTLIEKMGRRNHSILFKEVHSILLSLYPSPCQGSCAPLWSVTLWVKQTLTLSSWWDLVETQRDEQTSLRSSATSSCLWRALIFPLGLCKEKFTYHHSSLWNCLPIKGHFTTLAHLISYQAVMFQHLIAEYIRFLYVC